MQRTPIILNDLPEKCVCGRHFLTSNNISAAIRLIAYLTGILSKLLMTIST